MKQGRQYGARDIDPDTLLACPLKQLENWLQDAMASGSLDPLAMHLATVDPKSCPDTRVVLLKAVSADGLLFFTDYTSAKGQHLAQNAQAAASFYWPESARQIRVRGRCIPCSRDLSKQYFSGRQRASQLAASASRQSTVIASRQTLLADVAQLDLPGDIACPERWGGYYLSPQSVEFFQGRDNRVNDRFRYTLYEQKWQIVRLSP